jgi:N-acetylglucosamine-6-phosphate deacetylase
MRDKQQSPECILTNVQAVLPDRVQSGACVRIAGDRIAGIREMEAIPGAKIAGGAVAVDFAGDYMVPGLIDLHVHGCGGADTMDGTPAALAHMAKALLRQGTTAFLATTMTAGADHLREVLAVGADWPETGMQAEFLGFHLEGPCISPEYRGAQKPVTESAITNIIALFDRRVKIVTLAPELADADACLAAAIQKGIIVAAGHSGASFDEMRQAIDAGVRHLTHAFNAMPGIHHRKPGLLTAALLDPRVSIELIADGVHIHPAVLELALRLKGQAQVVLVSDGTRAVGMPDGDYDLGGQQVSLSQGRLTLPDGTIAGSAAPLLAGVRFMVRAVGRGLPEAVRMASLNPARVLGADSDHGSLRAGALANFLRLSPELELKEVWMRGRRVIDAASAARERNE